MPGFLNGTTAFGRRNGCGHAIALVPPSNDGSQPADRLRRLVPGTEAGFPSSIRKKQTNGRGQMSNEVFARRTMPATVRRWVLHCLAALAFSAAFAAGTQ